MYYLNIIKDITYGYVEVKCCNKSCNRISKVSRNSEVAKYPNNVSCNMGCALACYNTENKSGSIVSKS
jgi:hypothetical protein